MLGAPLGTWSRMVASIPKSYQVDPKLWLHGYIKHPSEHLEYRIEPQVLDWLALGKFRRLAIWYLLARQDYFELIPIRSNNLQLVRASLSAPLEHFPDQTGFFISLNVFEPVQNFPHDL